jgi:hypothetical protein
MAVEDGLLKTALTEVRYAIPVQILEMAGGQSFIDKVVTERLEEVRGQTLKVIPPSWRPKVVRYIVYRLKQAIFEAWKESETDDDTQRWKTHSMDQERVNEFLEEYTEAEASADDLMDTILKINSMRRLASVAGVVR